MRLYEATEIRPSPGLLDYETSDERIVGCAHAYRMAHPDRDVRFLTHDAGAMATARNADVPLVMVPDDWRGDPQPSPAERRAAELKAEVTRLQQTEPQFDIRFLSSAGEEVNEITGSTLAARSLAESEVSQLIIKLRSSVRRSRTRDWLKSCEEVLRNLHTSIQHQSERPFVTIEVTNGGNRPAEDALIEIVGHGPLLLGVPLDDDDKLRKRYRREPIRLPSLPKLTDSSLYHPYIPGRLAARDRGADDRNAFYYKPVRPPEPVPVIALECRQWRHGFGSQDFAVEIYVDSELPTIEGSIECRIHAKNLPDPAEAFIKVSLEAQAVDIAERAAQVVEQTIQQALADSASYGFDSQFAEAQTALTNHPPAEV